MSGINAYTLGKNSPYLGGTCPVCGGAFVPGERVVNCPASNTPHHVDCWAFNGNHCATFGCPGSGTVNVVAGATAAGTAIVNIEILGPDLFPPSPQPPQQPINRLATFAWGAAGIVVILTLLRLFTMWFAPPPTEVVYVTRVVVSATPTDVPGGGIAPTRTNTPQLLPTDTPEPPPNTPRPTSRSRPTATPKPRSTISSRPEPTDTPMPETSITSFRLVNGQTDRFIQTLENDDTVSIARAGRYLNIEVIVESGISSVLFFLDGEPFWINGRNLENGSPYAMAGDNSGNYYDNWDWQGLLGTHAFTAVACSQDGGGGICYEPFTVSVNIVR